MYRIFKNRFRKIIYRGFWAYLLFPSSTILSRENPETGFCCSKTLGSVPPISRQVAQLRIVLERN
jgi:hypothetical protein